MSTEQTEPPQQASLATRYAFKVVANFINFMVGFFTAGIVPRALGVKLYGDYSFLTSIFSQATLFFDFRTSTCFYVKLSQEQSEKKLLTFYAYYLAVVFSCVSVCSVLLAYTPLKGIALPGQKSQYILLAALTAFMMWLLEVLSSAMDAYGRTIILEKVRVANKIFTVASILLLYHLQSLDITKYFIQQIIFTTAMLGFIVVYLRKQGYWKGIPLRIATGEALAYAHSFFKYSYPLVGYMILGIFTSTYDRWLLQKMGGSTEQGLFSFSYGLMNVGYLFISAIQPLMVREMSIASSSKDYGRIAHLYLRFYPFLFAVTLYFCAFIFVQADQIVEIFGGSEYAASTVTFRILILYPLISVYSGLNGAIIYATGRTKVFLYLSLIFTPLGAGSLYLLLGKQMLDLGAMGLALKLVCLDMVSVIVVTAIISKFVKINFWRCMGHFVYALVFVLVAWMVRILLDGTNFAWSPVVHFLSAGVIYTVAIGAMVLWVPRLLGITRQNVDEFKNLLVKRGKQI